MQLGRFLRGLRSFSPKEYWKQLYLYRDIRPDAQFVGKDEFGNRYYEEYRPDTVFGRERWVIYANSEFDASQVPPEWHMWLHKIHDTTSCTSAITSRKHREPYAPNLSGTKAQYYPYNTTISKISSWNNH